MGVRVKVLVMIFCGRSTSQKNGGPGDYAKKVEKKKGRKVGHEYGPPELTMFIIIN